MNNSQFQDLINDQFHELMRISATKGREYARDATDRLANFKRLAKELNLEPEQVLWVYWTKHKDAIIWFINNLNTEYNVPLSEPIEGRIDDAILYLLLLKGLLKDRYGTHRSPDVSIGGGVPDPSDEFDETTRVASAGLSACGGQCSRPVDCGPGSFDVGGGQMVSEADCLKRDPVQVEGVLYSQATTMAGGSADAPGGRAPDWHPV